MNVEDVLFFPLPVLENQLRERGSRFRSIMDTAVRYRSKRYKEDFSIITIAGLGYYNHFLHLVDHITGTFTDGNQPWMRAVYDSFSIFIRGGYISNEGLLRIVKNIVRGLVTVSIISQHRGSMPSTDWLQLIEDLDATHKRVVSSVNLAGPEARQKPQTEVELFDIIWMGLVMTGPSPRFETGYIFQGLRRVRGIQIQVVDEVNTLRAVRLLDEDWLWADRSATMTFTIPELEQDFEIEVYRSGNVGLDHPRQTLTFIEHIPGTIYYLNLSVNGTWYILAGLYVFRISFEWED